MQLIFNLRLLFRCAHWDTAPQVDCLAPSEGDVLAVPAQGGAASRLPNVLAEDTWDLFRVLLR